ncbi:MAG: hypothetical protein ACYCVB_05020 [Bacilli bacterium]
MKRITRLAGATFVAGALMITPRVAAAASYPNFRFTSTMRSAFWMR